MIFSVSPFLTVMERTMKKAGWLLVVALVFAAGLSWAEDDPYQGWNTGQLKAEIAKLKKQVAELQAKTDSNSPDYSSGDSTLPGLNGVTKVDDFEKETPSLGNSWWEGCDQNKMGTTIAPDPYTRLKGGSPLSHGYCAGMKGHLGPNEEPWAWATLTLSLGNNGMPMDLTAYKAIRFYTMGDGKEHLIRLQKISVKDFADFEARFVSPKKWTQIIIPFEKFTQPDWGARLEKKFDDVKNIAFVPGLNDADYDFKVDDLELLK
jgi:hypothetical protein